MRKVTYVLLTVLGGLLAAGATALTLYGFLISGSGSDQSLGLALLILSILAGWQLRKRRPWRGVFD